MSDLPTQDEGESYADVVDIDPMQVGIRLHELRVAIEELAGVDPQMYWDLSQSERVLCDSIGEAIAEHFIANPAENAVAMARSIHNVRAYLAELFGDGLIPWEELEADQRDLGIRISQEIIDWLKKEGPR